jgi:hypothetical protein
LEDPGVNGRIVLKWIFETWVGRGINWIDLAQHRDRLWSLVNAVMNLRVLSFSWIVKVEVEAVFVSPDVPAPLSATPHYTVSISYHSFPYRNATFQARGYLLGHLTHEDGTDRLLRNVGA